MLKKYLDTRQLLLLNSLPIFLCCVLTYFPYFFYDKSELFSIRMKYGLAEHAVYALVPVAIFVIAALLGGTGRSVVDKASIVRINVSPHTRLFTWSLVFMCLAVQFWQNIYALNAYRHGGFIEAREDAAVNGIGFFIRLDIFFLPILAATLKSNKLFKWLLWLFIVNHMLRALLMSERIAITEIMFTAWVALPYRQIYGLSRAKMITILAVVFAAFSALLAMRLDQQNQAGAHIDSSSTSFTQSLSAYYADTTNKYYGVVSGDFTYPTVQILAPLDALLGDKKANKDKFADFLSNEGNSRGLVSSTLNNPGGLAQDISDFSYFGYFFIFIKFVVFYFIWTRRYRNALFASLSPFCLVSMIEYPRFNYLYVPYAFYVFAAAVLYGIYINVNSRRSRRFYQVQPEVLL